MNAAHGVERNFQFGMERVLSMKKMTKLTANPRLVDFLKKNHKAADSLPEWKRGVLEASSRAMSEMPRKQVYSPLAVAHEFCTFAYIPMQKLVKLVYLAHAWHLALTGEPLLGETVSAGGFGPDIPSIRESSVFSPAPLDYMAKAVIRRVWETHKEFSGVQLSSMTHQNDSPWAKAVDLGYSYIPNEFIKEHYKKLANQAARFCTSR